MITLNNLYDCENILDGIENLLKSASEDDADRLDLFFLYEKAKELRQNVQRMIPSV
jgi:hypothetical protein